MSHRLVDETAIDALAAQSYSGAEIAAEPYTASLVKGRFKPFAHIGVIGPHARSTRTLAKLTMRPAPRLRSSLLAALVFFAPTLAVANSADNIFIVDNSDGYGIDTCLASGASCGQAMADAWCRVHDFERAASFGKMKTDAILASASVAPVRTACVGAACTDSVAITCTR
ncbi:hypothetical protein MKI84_04260 [Ancylobacter sp. A5.8]|uniref:hypothetical protein n=1 Tax=Ancylobacter gelatini TaxID=2919920 RepID=UPI001F4E9FD9|nr:hypothetical protein [Ancylobacter gelatini]MCJ8142122.1 hypothetical protein [Ancylobacter gelatini]